MEHPIYVGLPVFNGGRTIIQALKSVQAQTYRDFHVLVYDDGSTDRTMQLVAQAANKDNRIRVISGDRNRGRGAARNRLLDEAKDGFIAWQDADDLWRPEKLQSQVDYVTQLEFSGVDLNDVIIISTYVRRTPGAKSEASFSRHVPPENYDLQFVCGNSYGQCPFQLQATFGRTEVFRVAGGFDENLNWAEDIDVCLKLLRAGKRILGHQAEKGLAVYNHTFAGARGDLVEASQSIVQERFRDFAAQNGIDIEAVFGKRKANYLFNIYMNNRNYAKAASLLFDQLQRKDLEGGQSDTLGQKFVQLVRAVAQPASEDRPKESQQIQAEDPHGGAASKKRDEHDVLRPSSEPAKARGREPDLLKGNGPRAGGRARARSGVQRSKASRQ